MRYARSTVVAIKRKVLIEGQAATRKCVAWLPRLGGDRLNYRQHSLISSKHIETMQLGPQPVPVRSIISHTIIVQKHKGRLEVHSQPGKTCFEVRLPLNFVPPAGEQ
jgi:hypothetical protein